MNYYYIDNDLQLADCCRAASQAEAVAVDTEFVRTRTYYPQLGLIQLFDGQKISLIDPLKIINWQPLIDLFIDNSVMKYLHAGGEDLEVFINRFNLVPTPMLDTQVITSFLGHPNSLGFAAMVSHYSGVILDKSESRTDWLARPLTETQCQYAAADVAYLLPIAKLLVTKASEVGRLGQIESECAMHIRRRQQVIKPEKAWLEITNISQLRPRQLAVLQLLAAWRLRTARQRDIAVNFVVKEDTLWKIARYLPRSLAELSALGLNGPEIRHHGAQLIKLVNQASELDELSLPAAVTNLIDFPNYRSIFNQIKVLVKMVSEQTGYSTELLASRRQINQLLSWHWGLMDQELTPELIFGWRGELMGERLQKILENC